MYLPDDALFATQVSLTHDALSHYAEDAVKVVQHRMTEQLAKFLVVNFAKDITISRENPHHEVHELQIIAFPRDRFFTDLLPYVLKRMEKEGRLGDYLRKYLATQ